MPTYKAQFSTLRTTAIVLASVWTFVSLASFLWDQHSNKRYLLSVAEHQASLAIEKDFALRNWVLSHGGVYVPVSDLTRPNPYIPDSIDKFATTDGGKRLTIMNPAYVTRQLYETGDMPEGIKGHLSSLNPMRSENMPDDWEEAGLKALESGALEYKGISDIEGEPYFRLMHPVMTRPGCSGCHEEQGYDLGQIGGGVSVSVPMQHFYDLGSGHSRIVGIAYIFFWGLGIFGIGIAYRKLKERIVNQQEAEEARRQSDYMLHSISRVAPVGIGVVVDRTITWANKQLESLTGYTEDEMVGRNARFLYHSDDEYEFVGLNKYKQIDERGVGTVETRFRKKDGSSINVLLSSTPIDQEDLGRGVTFTVLDITERKRYEERLKRSKDFLQTIIDSFPESILVINTDHSIAMMNVTARENCAPKYLEEDRIHCYQISHHLPEPCLDADSLCPMARVVETKAKVITEHTHFDKDGNKQSVEVIAAPIFDENGNVIQIIESCIDITSRKEAEQERLQLQRQIQNAQKLESLGILAGGIAHDFNNLLVGVLGNAEIALSKVPSESPARDNLDNIITSSMRAADLAKEMLAYSGKGRFVIEPTDLNALVGEMSTLLETTTSKRAVLQFSLASELSPVNADKTQIRQVFMNLVTNASESMTDNRGVITISTGIDELNTKQLGEMSGSEEASAGTFEFIEVKDTGCGMDAEILKKIFDPFYTTKFTGRGLGMAATLGIMRGHRGAIAIKSEPGAGTTIRIYFPCHEDGVAAGEPPEVQDQDSWSGVSKAGTVLIVDDEPLVRETVSNVLKEAGYGVLTASDGEEGVRLFSEQKDEIDLILLDLVMPNMGGVEALGALRNIDPHIRVVLSSGYNEKETIENIAGKGPDGFIQKPYRISELIQIVKRLMIDTN